MKTKFIVVEEVWTESRKSENRKSSEGLRIEFLSVVCHFENLSVYFYKILTIVREINYKLYTHDVTFNLST